MRGLRASCGVMRRSALRSVAWARHHPRPPDCHHPCCERCRARRAAYLLQGRRPRYTEFLLASQKTPSVESALFLFKESPWWTQALVVDLVRRPVPASKLQSHVSDAGLSLPLTPIAGSVRFLSDRLRRLSVARGCLESWPQYSSEPVSPFLDPNC